MSRSDIPNVDDRRPFYLYVDEFQNFATDSFATILSEARKYGLNLTVANQYISQMEDTVRNAVFGNVGTTISFRVSADDSPILAKQFTPQFEPEDLLQMNNRHFVMSMVIQGEKVPGFSATTLTLPPAQTDFTPQIVEYSRLHYARPREDVEREIGELISPQSAQQQQQQQQPQPQNQPKAAQPKSAAPAPKVKAEVTPPAPKPTIKTDVAVKFGSVVAPKPEEGERGKGAPAPAAAPPTDAPAPTAATAGGEPGSGKRKRKRRRKGKGSSESQQGSTPQSPAHQVQAPQPMQPAPAPKPSAPSAPKIHEVPNGETIIRLR
jgi:hypothetical protein